MKYVLIFGASITHGVGGTRGWADMLKTMLHADMYEGSQALGERCEIYELGIPGETARDILARMETEIHARIPHGAAKDAYIVLSAGLNDSKAKDRADNFPETADDFATTTRAIINLAKTYAQNFLGVGLTPVSETKTNPKTNPLTGGKSYFKNTRIKQFEHTFAAVCKAEAATFVPIFEHVPQDWQTKLLFADGVHPNDSGHTWLFERVKPAFQKFIGKIA